MDIKKQIVNGKMELGSKMLSARDLAILSEKYRITAVRPVDMFPHTHHVENVVALELK